MLLEVGSAEGQGRGGVGGVWLGWRRRLGPEGCGCGGGSHSSWAGCGVHRHEQCSSCSPPSSGALLPALGMAATLAFPTARRVYSQAWKILAATAVRTPLRARTGPAVVKAPVGPRRPLGSRWVAERTPVGSPVSVNSARPWAPWGGAPCTAISKLFSSFLSLVFSL